MWWFWYGAESFDQNGDGHIDAKEVQQVLKNLKMFKSEEQVLKLIKVRTITSDPAVVMDWECWSILCGDDACVMVVGVGGG